MAKPRANKARRKIGRPAPETAHRMRMEKVRDPSGIATYKWVAAQVQDPVFRLAIGPGIVRRWGRAKALTAFILLWAKQHRRAPKPWEVESLDLNGETFLNWLDRHEKVTIEPPRQRRGRKAKNNSRWKAAGDKFRQEMAETRESFAPSRARLKRNIQLAEEIDRKVEALRKTNKP